MPQIDIDKVMERLGQEPWDLVLTVKGQACRVRPLAVADLDRLAAVEAAPADRARQMLSDFFQGGAGTSDWDAVTVSHVLAAIVGYQQERVRKNCRRLAREVAAGQPPATE